MAAPFSSAGVERVFSAAGRMHDDLRKSEKDSTLEHSLFAAFNGMRSDGGMVAAAGCNRVWVGGWCIYSEHAADQQDLYPVSARLSGGSNVLTGC